MHHNILVDCTEMSRSDEQRVNWSIATLSFRMTLSTKHVVVALLLLVQALNSARSPRYSCTFHPESNKLTGGIASRKGPAYARCTVCKHDEGQKIPESTSRLVYIKQFKVVPPL